MGKDGEQGTIIFSELRVTKGFSWTQRQLEDSVQDETTNKVISPESRSVGYTKLECENHLKCLLSNATELPNEAFFLPVAFPNKE